MQLTLYHTLDFAPASPSPRVREVAAMFGLGMDRHQTLELIPPTTLTLRPHQLIFITGPSGSGKSTLLRLITAQTPHLQPKPRAEQSEAPDRSTQPLLDTFPDLTLDDTLRLLSRVGLGDAFVLLRTVGQLSEGQHARYRLAQIMAATEAHLAQPPEAPRNPDAPHAVVPADEFGSTLDRVTAKALARKVRRWVDQQPICLIAATTHDDLLEALAPDTLIHKPLGAGVEVIERSAGEIRNSNHRNSKEW